MWYDTTTNIYHWYSSCDVIYLNPNMNNMFEGCRSLTSLDLSPFDASKVSSMIATFNNCVLLNEINLSNFNTHNVTNMNSMFSGCNKLISLDLSSFDTSNVTMAASMFDGCTSLTSLDLSHFDTRKIEAIIGMFSGCGSLTSLDLSSFDTSSVYDMRYLFMNDTALERITWGPLFSNKSLKGLTYNNQNNYSYQMFNKCKANKPDTLLWSATVGGWTNDGTFIKTI